ncbi:hypothetical protein GCM10012290_15900 [Halolactibacillus alkaliphilus]|uniref:AMP-dependent synthetase/ligase domain-containing protein n=1 Tax=Halolactibacillus alkaliphilus TaxID=442899 RepID=A0A511X1G2_9BACI|nr:AMP-binding protein [Halolactibacillus alkaliphilus]GEN56775.1 hypothetical protein HAL01_12390 [Halolactibacillus alkaliphilus]GGN71239.1 hypothetical protein GCM10012290_15900 [Halolactibacillus alkaliphilus]SFO81466.1 AMP-binding enzyme [Halolactibacillus alkaliphilus]
MSMLHHALYHTQNGSLDAPKTNAAFHLIDRHLDLGKGDDICHLAYLKGNSIHKTFHTFKSKVVHYSQVLMLIGVKAGDKILVYVDDSLLFQQALLAVIRLGAVAVIVDQPSSDIEEISETEQVKVLITTYRLRKTVDVSKMSGLEQQLCVEHMNQLAHERAALDVTWVSPNMPMVILYYKQERYLYQHKHITLIERLADQHLIQSDETVLLPDVAHVHPLFYWLSWIKGAAIFTSPITINSVKKLAGYVALIGQDCFNQVIKADSELEALAFNKEAIYQSLYEIGDTDGD